jgi:hypothetical protein
MVRKIRIGKKDKTKNNTKAKDGKNDKISKTKTKTKKKTTKNDNN